MPPAQIQCFCGEIIGLGPPKQFTGQPQTFTAKCPCGRNWRLVLSHRNPGYKPCRAPCGAGAHAGNGDKEIAP